MSDVDNDDVRRRIKIATARQRNRAIAAEKSFELLRIEHERLLQSFADKDSTFEFHVKQLAEANLQLERRNDELQIEVLDCLLEMHLRGIA